MVILNEACVVPPFAVDEHDHHLWKIVCYCSDKILCCILYNVFGLGVHMSSPVTVLLEKCVKCLL